MRKNKFYINCTLISILISFLSSGCSSEGKKGQNMAELPPLKVSTYEIKSNDIPVSMEYPAKIKSMQQVNVVARVNGILEKKNFTEGSYVKEGEILYQIDSTRYEASMQEALADVEIKTATLKPAYRDWETDRKSTRLNSSHRSLSRMPSSA